MNTLQQQQDDGHIIMFPYMAQGHITRFLALARFISQRKPNIKITFVSTPLNVRRLQSALTSDKNIHLAELPFSSADHGLPADSYNTNSLPPHLILTLLYASESLKPLFDNPVTQIIATEKRVPSCIIGDTLYGWVHETAKRVGTFHFAFTCGAYGSAMFISTCLHLPHRRDDNSNDLIEEFQVPKVPGTCRLSQLPVYLREANKETPHVKYFQKQGFNSKMMQEELGVSVQLANGNEGQVSSEEVQKVIEQVMDSSEGEEMRRKAMVIAEKISAAMREDEGSHLKGSSVRSIDNFLATVTTKKVLE
ncbi:hypothetical protein C5167_024202 [Papaver somniferum]|uniref:Glycosyltransferase N-terminal domain-containing protein n=1 Tax=Papaver somniferum TaxID=3469 RepID=A0A4Y7JRS2_PAPSO|nr:crocetin glucosyltransferase 3-like [Papaver somniferum]RZC62449.1 hypothetical protein C5167_024202 [Papaver somniferum]